MSDKKLYIYVFVGHESLRHGKHAIVELPDQPDTYIRVFADMAKEKVCERLNLPKDEVTLIDYRFFGEDVMIIRD